MGTNNSKNLEKKSNTYTIKITLNKELLIEEISKSVFIALEKNKNLRALHNDRIIQNINVHEDENSITIVFSYHSLPEPHVIKECREQINSILSSWQQHGFSINRHLTTNKPIIDNNGNYISELSIRKTPAKIDKTAIKNIFPGKEGYVAITNDDMCFTEGSPTGDKQLDELLTGYLNVTKNIVDVRFYCSNQEFFIGVLTAEGNFSVASNKILNFVCVLMPDNEQAKEVRFFGYRKARYALISTVSGKAYSAELKDSSITNISDSKKICFDPVLIKISENSKVDMIADGLLVTIDSDEKHHVFNFGRKGWVQISPSSKLDKLHFQHLRKTHSNKFHTLFLTKTGHVYVYGTLSSNGRMPSDGESQFYGHLGLGQHKSALIPTRISGINNVIDVCTTQSQSWFLTSEEKVYACGYFSSEDGRRFAEVVYSPKETPFFDSKSTRKMCSDIFNRVYFITKTGEVFLGGRCIVGELKNTIGFRLLPNIQHDGVEPCVDMLSLNIKPFETEGEPGEELQQIENELVNQDSVSVCCNLKFRS